MYNTSADYKEYIKKPSRQFECKVVIGNRTFNNSDIIQIVPNVTQPKSGFSIGNTISQSVDITLRNDGGVYASAGKAEVEIGLKTNNSMEWIPIGTFNIDDVTKTDYTVKITAYDNMFKFETGYFSNLEDNSTLQEVVNELASITSVEFTGIVPNYTVTKLQGFTCREVLGYVASICGGNSYITRDGKFTIAYPTEVDNTITADNYITYKLEDQEYKIGMITCRNKNNSSSSDTSYDSTNDTNTISAGSLASDTMELTFENPWVTTAILNDIYNKLKDFSYLGYTLKWQGDLSLDPMDIVTIIDKNNVTRKALVFANKLNYTGGLVAETNAKGETKNSNSFNSSGPTTKNVERLSVKLLIAEQALINKASIQDLQANSARIDNLQASIATIDTALINYASVTQLDAVKANVADLNASVANIDSALINKANVADLTAANANISNLSADMANVKTLINGNLTSANIQSLVLTSSKVTVDNGFIKNAMIESLDVTKINAGTLNTNKISVSSSDGGMVIAGATQQFKDSSGNVRLQLGQDAQGNFNFILMASDGTTTLIDGYGVKEKAIADKLIKANMVADSAIGEQQINYSSFITGFNKATNTSYINASKISIDLTGQTMDVAFSNMNTTVNGLQTTTSNNSTSISAIQGQISTLISNTTITQNGTTTQLKDAYNGTVSTINSMQTTIGQHTTSINANTGNITSINSNISSIQASLNSISASLNSTQSTVTTQSTQISTVTTTANNALSAINNLSVGSRNLYINSSTGIAYATATKDYTSGYDSGCKAIRIVYGNSVLCRFVNVIVKNGTYSVSFYAKSNTSSSYHLHVDACDKYVANGDSYTLNSTWQYFKFEGFVVDNYSSATYNFIDIECPVGADILISHIMIVEGSKATTWALAPEDINSSISAVNITATNALNTANTATSNIATLNTTVNTTISRVSSLELTANSITTRVGNTETAISSLAIGGRNLIINSNFSNGLTYWSNTGSGGTINVDSSMLTPKGNNSVKLQGNGTNSRLGLNYLKSYTANTGDSFVLSFYIYATDVSTLSSQLSNGLWAEDSGNGGYSALGYIFKFSSLKSNTWYQVVVPFTITSSNNTNAGLYITALQTTSSTFWIGDIKIEKGNKVTDFTVAPEDVDASIASVKDYATQTINSNVSTINQTTTSIQAQVTSLQSSISTINTTLGNKADAITVTSVTNRVSTLESSVTGINASITTLNSNVSSVTTTANSALSAINGLSIGGRNLLTYSDITSSSQWNLSSYASLDTSTKYNNHNSVKVNISGKASNTFSGFNIPLTQPLKQNTTYIVSFYAYTTNNTQIDTGGFRIYLPTYINGTLNSWNSNLAILSSSITNNTWTKFTMTFTTGAITSNGNLMMDFQQNGLIWIAIPKLEEGNKATDWSPAPEDTSNQITNINSNVSSLQSSVSVLQSQIALKVEQSNIDSAVTTINGQIVAQNTTISNLQAQINLQATQISSKVSANDVGTIITQSPTQVMTAFNNISSYFKVNSSGATFGDTSTGDYTTVGSGGLKHHVNGTDYDYFYVVYIQNASFTLASGTGSMDYVDTFVNFDANLKGMLNGRVPKQIVVLTESYTRYLPSGWSDSLSNTYGDAYIKSFDSTGFTVSSKINTYGYTTTSGVNYPQGYAHGGSYAIKILVLS